MHKDINKQQYFIIGGTEKAGTTSIFTYFSGHPGVCGSSVKETNFFRDLYQGDQAEDIAYYNSFFNTHTRNSIYMEASPSYLGDAKIVSSRIQELIPDAKILFILRDPIERFYSSYNFHMGKLNLPADMTCKQYFEKCIEYDRGEKPISELGIDEWYLKVLSYGKYAELLKYYRSDFSADSIKILFYEEMKIDLQAFVGEICDFLDLDKAYFDGYEFRKVNVTFSGKNKVLHKLAVILNEKLESMLRQRPAIKQWLVNAYKKVNQAREGYESIDDSDKKMLIKYYRSSVSALSKILDEGATVPWEHWR